MWAEYSDSIKKSFLFWMGISLVFHLLAAWYSIGYMHYDEHYQILEFAALKLGWTKPQFLAWEYAARIRPALQPGFVIWLTKTFHIKDPFSIAYCCRMIAGVFAWSVSWLFTLVASRQVESERAKRNLFILTAIYCFLAFIHVRFSSEGMAGSFCFLAISLLMIYWQKEPSKMGGVLLLLLAGLCFGLAYVCRIQVAIIPIGLMFWAIFKKKIDARGIFIIIAGAWIAIGIGVVSDWWFYGEWVNTAYNYFHSNIIENKAASFGVMPWYNYIQVLAFMPFDLFGLLLIFAFLYYFYRNLTSIFTWICIPFLLAHFMAGHKELRFLFPLINIVPFIVVVAIEDIRAYIRKFSSSRANVLVASGRVLLFTSIFLASFSFCVCPAGREFGIYEHVNSNYEKDQITLAGVHAWPFGLHSLLPLMFYNHSGYNCARFDKAEQLDSVLLNKKGKVLLYTIQRGVHRPTMLDTANVKSTLVYCSVPGFLRDINFNKWQDRTTIVTVYEVEQKKD